MMSISLIFHKSPTILFEEKRLQFEKIVLLGHFNNSLNVNNDASKIWDSFFEDFGLTQYVCEKTYSTGGILDHLIASNNISINVKSNSFITLCTIRSLSIVKQRKPQHQSVYRNWKKVDSEGFVKLLKPCLKFD